MARNTPPRPELRTLPKTAYRRIAALAAAGSREVDIARDLKMNFRTWKRILQDDPEALTAFEEGRGVEHSALRGELFRQAMEGGNTTAAIFLLKCRHGYIDKGVTDVTEAGRVVVEFRLPEALAPAQYQAAIEGRKVEVNGDD